MRILEPESEIMTKKKKKRRKLWCLKRLCLRERTYINIHKYFKIFINILKSVRTAYRDISFLCRQRKEMSQIECVFT